MAPKASPAKAAPKSAKPKSDKPKRARSAYILWSIDARADVVAKNADAGPADIMKLLGAQWREVDAKTKEKYQGMADAEKKSKGGFQKK